MVNVKPLRRLLDRAEPLFQKGGKLEKLYPLYEAVDTFLYTPSTVTSSASHVRDALDQKRLMITVVMALVPCIFMAFYNTGLQANLALQSLGLESTTGWRAEVFSLLGLEYDPTNVIANVIHGGLYFIPIFLVANIAGGLCEFLFAVIRKHEINEGFLVTGVLYPLTLPPTLPLWQVAVGIIFGVVIGKEIFGGTSKNFLNVALTARAFLYFAYPSEISGNAVWTAVDGYTGATALAIGAEFGMEAVQSAFTWQDAFLGFIPGSMGETSTLACLFGALVLIVSKVGSWRIMLSCSLGAYLTALLFYSVGSSTNPMFEMSPIWHFLVGGLSFGVVFMATDPVSAAMTSMGKYIYGLLIGFMAIFIRVLNPGFPEGIMLAILFGNIFAPLIDYYVVSANIRRRRLRSVQ